MRKLIILPSSCAVLSGMTVSLALMIEGFARCGFSEQLCVLVHSGSLMEEYLQQHLNQSSCLQSIEALDENQFFKLAFRWVNQQPQDWPLLLENWFSSRQLLPTIALAIPSLCWSSRPVFHFFHDLASSYNSLGNIARKLTFAGLSPSTICNSAFTAKHINQFFAAQIEGILYQPVDTREFSEGISGSPPQNLQPILDSGAKIMLTPSRISKPKKLNDKNLRGLIPVLAELKARGENYHQVIIGHDFSAGKTRTLALQEMAASYGVADRLTILPPTFSIQDYYHYADLVITLAPREPFGRTVVEAIACNVPVVGSQTGGIGEILRNFAPDWAVDPDRPKAIAEAIVSIETNPNTANILTKGKNWVEKHCSNVEYAQKIRQIVNLDSSKLKEQERMLLSS